MRLAKNIERLITAYQEGLLSLSQLRERMPELNKKSKAVEAELQSLETGVIDDARYLQLAENLNGFRKKLQARAKTLDVCERQQILRLLVKEILVDPQSLTIRHSIPIPQASLAINEPQPPNSTPSVTSQQPGYLLRPRSKRTALRRPLVHRAHQPVFHHPSLQKRPEQLQQTLVADSADSCRPVRTDRSILSFDSETSGRSPEVSSPAFRAQPPDLQPVPLMDTDFAVMCPLVRHRMPQIRFLYISSRLCSTLLSDPTSR
jgi:hypothetical protein